MRILPLILLLSFLPVCLAEETAGDASVFFKQGKDYYDAGQWEQAEAALKKAIEINPDLAEAYPVLMAVHYQRAEWLPGLETARTALQKAGQIADTHYYYGLLLSEYGLSEDAAAAFEKALEIDPHHQGARQRVLLVEADTYRLKGDNEKALAAYEDFVSRGEGNAKAYYYLGQLYEKKEMLDKALGAYEQSTALDPHFTEANKALGSLAFELKKWPSAIRAYEELTETESDKAHYFSELGYLYQVTESLDRAAGAYQKAVELDPQDHVSWFNLGGIYQKKAAWPQAADAFRHAIEIKSDDPDYYASLSAVACQSGDREGAWGAYQKIGELKGGERPELLTYLNHACPKQFPPPAQV